MTEYIFINGWACEPDTLNGLAEAFNGQVIRNSYYSNGTEDSLPQVLEQSKAKEIVLIGYSLGGLQALKCTEDKRIKAIVLISSFSNFCSGVNGDKRLKKLRTLQLNSMIKQCGSSPAELISNFFQNVYSPAKAPELCYEFYNSEELAKGLEELKSEADTSKVTAPCLILHGEDDQIVPVDFAKDLKQVLKNTELKTFETCGHALPMLHSAEIIEEIKVFIQKLNFKNT